jgi:hypothetical protein
MRPGAPDSTLEGKRLERIQIGGVLFTLVTAVFIPVYWLPEANRQASFQGASTKSRSSAASWSFSKLPRSKRTPSRSPSGKRSGRSRSACFSRERYAGSIRCSNNRGTRCLIPPRRCDGRGPPWSHTNWFTVFRSTQVSGAPTLWNAGC